MASASIRVLIVDDSTFVRTMVRSALSDHSQIEVIGFASSGPEALDRIAQFKPDVVTIDVEMAGRGGFELLDQLQGQCPVGIVMLSSLTREGAVLALQALEKGAFDYAVKPRKTGVDGIPRFREMLSEKIIAAARAKTTRTPQGPLANPVGDWKPGEIEPGWITAIGIGEGGPQTLLRLLPAFPAGFPAIVIAQHMPAYFGQALAEQLSTVCPMIVKEAVQDETVVPGTILLSPGGMHMEIVRRGDSLAVQLDGGPRMSDHRPSINVLFDSIAKVCGPKSVGVLMTGSGRDGVSGLSKLREAGAWTLVQDRSSSPVFGMAAAAVKAGIVDQAVPVAAISSTIASLLRQGCRENASMA